MYLSAFSYTCLKRHLVEDTPIRREVEAFLASESQCNCGQENCQHNLAFPINTAASTETTKKVCHFDSCCSAKISVCQFASSSRKELLFFSIWDLRYQQFLCWVPPQNFYPFRC